MVGAFILSITVASLKVLRLVAPVSAIVAGRSVSVSAFMVALPLRLLLLAFQVFLSFATNVVKLFFVPSPLLA